jgi:hypothetical protein
MQVYRRSVEKQKQAKILVYFAIIKLTMEYRLLMRNVIHFIVGDKA